MDWNDSVSDHSVPKHHNLPDGTQTSAIAIFTLPNAVPADSTSLTEQQSRQFHKERSGQIVNTGFTYLEAADEHRGDLESFSTGDGRARRDSESNISESNIQWSVVKLMNMMKKLKNFFSLSHLVREYYGPLLQKKEFKVMDVMYVYIVILNAYSIYLFIYLFIYVFIYLCIYLFIYLFIYLCIYVFMYLFIYLFIYLTTQTQTTATTSTTGNTLTTLTILTTGTS